MEWLQNDYTSSHKDSLEFCRWFHPEPAQLPLWVPFRFSLTVKDKTAIKFWLRAEPFVDFYEVSLAGLRVMNVLLLNGWRAELQREQLCSEKTEETEAAAPARQTDGQTDI